jgi:hypothetical protein
MLFFKAMAGYRLIYKNKKCRCKKKLHTINVIKLKGNETNYLGRMERTEDQEFQKIPFKYNQTRETNP